MATDETTLRDALFDAAREWGITDDRFTYGYAGEHEYREARELLNCAIDAALAAAEARGREKERARCVAVVSDVIDLLAAGEMPCRGALRYDDLVDVAYERLAQAIESAHTTITTPPATGAMEGAG